MHLRIRGLVAAAVLIGCGGETTDMHLSAVWPASLFPGSTQWVSHIVPIADGTVGPDQNGQGMVVNIGAAVGAANVGGSYYVVCESTNGDFLMFEFDTDGVRVSGPDRVVDRAGVYCEGRCGRLVETAGSWRSSTRISARFC